MEERIGELWHRLVTRAASSDHPEATVTLEAVTRETGVLFRALGGDGGLRVVAGNRRQHGARRHWLQRLAGSGERAELASRDCATLQLPPRIALFADAGLNRDLYLWLAALAARHEPALSADDWLEHNRRLSHRLITDYPGLTARYHRLVEAHLGQRPDPRQLPPAEAAQEQAIRAALGDPARAVAAQQTSRPPAPVPLWLYPPLQAPGAQPPAEDTGEPNGGGGSRQRDRRRRQGERVALPDGRRGLIFNRFETLLSWAEYVKVDRATEEDDAAGAERAAEDLQLMSLAQGGKPSAAKLRFDLDLPAAENDDLVLGPGIHLPEWDYRRGELRPDHCLVLPMAPRHAKPLPLPPRLRAPALRLRRRLELLTAAPRWQRGERDGQELDLEAVLRQRTEAARGQADTQPAVYRAQRRDRRDLATLLLADLSLSTDAWLDDHQRVIDVIRDALLLFGESLHALRDRFAIHGFSSRRRDHVRYFDLKRFDQPYDDRARGQLQAIRPGYYTRMGAAIRHAGSQLAAQPAGRRVLLLLTDGKPNDLDLYEGRYGVEDTRQAIREVRRLGLHPFCVTIDGQAPDYLPHLFGSSGYAVVRNPAELPHKLPQLYAQLTL